MPGGVFISHAFADKPLVDPFVDKLIRLGSEVAKDEIFYSSGEDTGVPSGENLNSYVQAEVADATLVVAIITPTFQTRPFCVAELGAAWSRTGHLFPLALPGMARTSLDGVLDGMMVKYLDESEALDELHDRVVKATSRLSSASTWGRYKAQWLAEVDDHVKLLPKLRTVSVEDFDRLESDFQGAQDALKAVNAEKRQLAEQMQELAAVRPADKVAAVLLPKDEFERFEALRWDASLAVGKLDSIVGEVMFHEQNGDGAMPWPDRFNDDGRWERADAARLDGYLIDNGNEMLVTDSEVAEVKAAEEAVDALRKMLRKGSDEFHVWFREKYGRPADLQKRVLWEQLFMGPLY
jgi:hypothetical protein